MSEQKKSIDPGVLQMLSRASELNIFTAFDRAKAQSPQCGFGSNGICCRICIQGPCRIMPKKQGGNKGICGATDYTIVARNLVRAVAGGASAHSDHGRHIAMALLHVAEGKTKDYEIKDINKLKKIAARIGIETEGKTPEQLAKEVALAALEDYQRLSGFGEATWVKTTVTEGRVKKLRETKTMPAGINSAIVELLSQTHMGMDADPVSIIFGGLKAAMGDYTGMHISTDLSDVIFGTPVPTVTEANLGVIKENKVNIAVHGHNPLLSELIVRAAKEMEAEAKAAGAEGINCVGICCTGNEVLMRQGVPIATSFGSQELAIMTGALDAMVVDVQCIMPGLQAVCECFHTKLITTSDIAKIPGAYHVYFNEEDAMENARKVIRLAIENYKERDGQKVYIPQIKNKVVGGWSLEALLEIFAAINPERPISVLTDAILNGEIKGVALFAGCNNLKGVQDEKHIGVIKKMVANDVFVVATGCSAQAFAKHGLLNGEAVEEFAGPGLKAFLNRLNEANAGKISEKLPLVFHMGSCVDNSRASDLLMLMADELGVDTPRVPWVASAPEAMSEKAIAIGSWCVTLGMPVHVGTLVPVEGSKLVYGVVTNIAEDVFGGYLILEQDYEKAAEKMLNKLEERAWRLRIRKKALAQAAELAGK
ncbi:MULTISPECIES: anaerobic carbon-monoxide dehydrogenase catalytic subunit [unclassified Carboxydocella]|uniref:anaerobic carbon-monoxide dehydrogenase catalytic subunit n=1 Tax=unclassified Carboxydocella TaxID=2685367 RepID=UPI0009AD8CD5|nr:MULTISPECIES: anaerobic carbon-monoxide dehydrogenase catalytic subunit [unclassified Carboxydocella]AVX31260.1 Ni-dependent carbon monoxide dehydrogenase CooS [Carboxydocella thermautotrophica]GAW29989.1 carbon-monoxide dehydrogenase catalytic subunit [Carboxydocella sp. ULO1]GAW30408.1 carbon-monoxide dehydrogenase catalytic subunit [Carboxydocella sp. JDF658]